MSNQTCNGMPQILGFSESYLDSRVLLLGNDDGDFEVGVVAVGAADGFDGDCDLDALSDGFDCCRLCCCCWPSADCCWSLSSSRDLK